jgi:hypothetical protein
MAEVEARLIEGQIEARIRTPWDDELALPPMDRHRRGRIARGLSPKASSARLSLLAVSVAVVLGVIVTTLGIDLHSRELEPSASTGALSAPLTAPPPLPTTTAATTQACAETPPATTQAAPEVPPGPDGESPVPAAAPDAPSLWVQW